MGWIWWFGCWGSFCDKPPERRAIRRECYILGKQYPSSHHIFKSHEGRSFVVGCFQVLEEVWRLRRKSDCLHSVLYLVVSSSHRLRLGDKPISKEQRWDKTKKRTCTISWGLREETSSAACIVIKSLYHLTACRIAPWASHSQMALLNFMNAPKIPWELIYKITFSHTLLDITKMCSFLNSKLSKYFWTDFAALVEAIFSERRMGALTRYPASSASTKTLNPRWPEEPVIWIR
jgi:hypothetical protein